MGVVGTILNLLVAIPKAIGLVESFAREVVFWWVSRQKADVLGKIVDAAAFAQRAGSQEERVNAARKWQDALSQPRTSD